MEDPFADVPILHRATSELYLFDTEADIFVIQEKEVTADLASNGDHDSELGRQPAVANMCAELILSLVDCSSGQNAVHLAAYRL